MVTAPRTSLARCGFPILALCTLLLGACGGPAREGPGEEVARPAEILEIASGGAGSGLRFPGLVRAVERADLTFSVPGKIVDLPVREGEQIRRGTLVARLDPESAQLNVDAARARFLEAKSEFERVEKLWNEQIVSRADLDARRTAMEVARSALSSAEKGLADTRLTAPFDGLVARRYVENHQNVQAKEPIISLQNAAELEIVIDVPERIIRSAPSRTLATASFGGDSGRRYPVRVSSYTTEADRETQTYEVILSFERPDDIRVLPGMPATVYPARAAGDEEGAPLPAVPLKSVVSTSDDAPFVWVVDPATSRATRREVRVGDARGNDVIIIEGLEAGDRVIVSGVHHIREGMLIRPLDS